MGTAERLAISLSLLACLASFSLCSTGPCEVVHPPDCSRQAPGSLHPHEQGCHLFHRCDELGKPQAFICPAGTRFLARGGELCAPEGRVSCRRCLRHARVEEGCGALTTPPPCMSPTTERVTPMPSTEATTERVTTPAHTTERVTVTDPLSTPRTTERTTQLTDQPTTEPQLTTERTSSIQRTSEPSSTPEITTEQSFTTEGSSTTQFSTSIRT